MALVTLVVGLTYTYKNRTFLKDQGQVISAPEDLDYFRDNGHFMVTADKPESVIIAPKPKKPVKPLQVAPVEVAEEAPEEEQSEEEELARPEDEVLAEGEEEVVQPEAETEAEPEPEPLPPIAPKPSAKSPRKGQFQKGGKRA